ncbi:MAG: gliding motility protein GldB [Tannerellaceae bacterium]|nr:gliding motility protein GldB [Tannerellaceae bacterium]
MRAEIFLLFALLLSCTSCKSQEKNPFSDAEPIHIRRFDKDLYRLIDSGDSTLRRRLLREYPNMFEVIGKGILNMQSPETPGFFGRLTNYYSEPTLKGLYRDAITLYDNIDDIEQQLGCGFACLKHHFPSMSIPNVYMHVSGLNQNVLVAENLLSVSIDKYMGKTYPLYLDFFYDYQLENMQRSHVVPDYLSGWLLAEYPFTGKENVLLERMIYEGKIKYLVSQALPDIPPYELMGYSESDYEWCKAHEKTIWKAIIERKHLYTPDHMTTNKYIENTPSTFLSSDAPGKLGIWMGWQIVNKYMQETQTTPGELMKQENAQEILTASKYKPF